MDDGSARILRPGGAALVLQPLGIPSGQTECAALAQEFRWVHFDLASNEGRNSTQPCPRRRRGRRSKAGSYYRRSRYCVLQDAAGALLSTEFRRELAATIPRSGPLSHLLGSLPRLQLLNLCGATGRDGQCSTSPTLELPKSAASVPLFCSRLARQARRGWEIVRGPASSGIARSASLCWPAFVHHHPARPSLQLACRFQD